MNAMRFDDRAVLVTGAGGGIGSAYVRLLASLGASIVVNDLGTQMDGSGKSNNPAQELVDEVTANGGRAVVNTGSVTSEDDVQGMVDQALTEFGRLDAVISNAGIITYKPFNEYTVDEYRQMMEIHFFGSLLVAKAAWPIFAEAGYGRIVNTTSLGALGVLNATAYGAAKGALVGFTNSLAIDGAEHGIKANCIAPAGASRMNEDVLSTPEMKAAMPPELVAPATAYLAHEDCELNGAVLSATGGFVHRWAVHQTEGYGSRDLTPDDVRDNIGAIRDNLTMTEVSLEVVTGAPLELFRNSQS